MNNNLPAEKKIFGLTFAIGFAVCLAVSKITGRREAWDSGLYFSAAIPLMTIVIFAISYRFPRMSWRWTLSMAVGQSLAIALAGGDFSLWPLGIIAMIVCSIPQFAAGAAASLLAKKST